MEEMQALDLQSIRIEDEAASFPATNIGIVTYTMVVSCKHGAVPVQGAVHASSVYVETGAEWKVVLHTQSMTPS